MRATFLDGLFYVSARMVHDCFIGVWYPRIENVIHAYILYKNIGLKIGIFVGHFCI